MAMPLAPAVKGSYQAPVMPQSPATIGSYTPMPPSPATAGSGRPISVGPVGPRTPSKGFSGAGMSPKSPLPPAMPPAPATVGGYKPYACPYGMQSMVAPPPMPVAPMPPSTLTSMRKALF
eukprot:5607120-Amphidinium_carterae.3